MKKVQSPMRLSEYVNKVKDKLKNVIAMDIKKALLNLSSTFRFFEKLWVKIAIWIPLLIGTAFIVVYLFHIQIFLWLIIGSILIFVSLVLFFIDRQVYAKAAKEINDSIDKEAIYKIAFDNLKGINYTRALYAGDDRLYKYRLDSIPSDASIISNSPMIQFSINKQHTGDVQAGTAHWTSEEVYTDSKGNTCTRTKHHYKNTGFIEIKTKNAEPKLSYRISQGRSLFSRGKKFNLENNVFNKSFDFKFNDPVKIRMLYTPLCMEETINLSKKSKIRTWSINKFSKNIIFSFAPTDKNQITINGKISRKNPQATINTFVEDIIEDTYNIYELLAIMLIPPLL